MRAFGPLSDGLTMDLRCPKCGSTTVEPLYEINGSEPYECTCNACGHSWDPRDPEVAEDIEEET